MKKNKIIISAVFITVIILISIIISLCLFIFQDKGNPMGKEIERKWLINKESIPYDLSKADKYKIVQIYISFSPEIRVRDINNGETYILTVKANMSVDGLTRDEKEYYITKEEYSKLLEKQEGDTIYKTRYQLKDNGDILAFDIFEEQLDGLAYLEIEFKSEEEAQKYDTPEWVTKDVTNDKRYKNGELSQHGIPQD